MFRGAAPPRSRALTPAPAVQHPELTQNEVMTAVAAQASARKSLWGALTRPLAPQWKHAPENPKARTRVQQSRGTR